MGLTIQNSKLMATSHAVFNPLIKFRALYLEERQNINFVHNNRA